MNVAELSLCKTLWELSGWGDTYARWSIKGDATGDHESARVNMLGVGDIPAYDLGYLLRKLPALCSVDSISQKDGRREWSVSAPFKLDTYTTADTPEDCAAKLAIELFKQGVLKK